jgi:hypothetical protein
VFSRNAAFSKCEAVGDTNCNDFLPLFGLLAEMMQTMRCLLQAQCARQAAAGGGRRAAGLMCGSQLENTNYNNFIVDYVEVKL